MQSTLDKCIDKWSSYKYYNLSFLLAFVLLCFFVIFTGIKEILSFFSYNYVGYFEAIIFSQIDLISFKRSGIKLMPNGNWLNVTDDTVFSNFTFWYYILLFPAWFLLVRFLVSDSLLEKVVRINFSSLKEEYEELVKNSKIWLEELDSKAKNKNSSSPQESQAEYEIAKEPPVHKLCPFCKEEVFYQAIKCKHCRSELPALKGLETSRKELDKKEDKGKFRKTESYDDKITWKHYSAIGFIFLAILFSGLNRGNSKDNSTSKPVKSNVKTYSNKLDRNDAETLCKKYIAKEMGRPLSIIRTSYVKYDGGHFVKAYYNRRSDGEYFEYVCNLYKNKILWAGVFDGTGLGRWRYESEMSYKRNTQGQWYLY